jgi:hypothetical protein
VWQIPTDHFDAGAYIRKGPSIKAAPLDEVLVQSSSYSRSKLKQRLFSVPELRGNARYALWAKEPT